MANPKACHHSNAQISMNAPVRFDLVDGKVHRIILGASSLRNTSIYVACPDCGMRTSSQGIEYAPKWLEKMIIQLSVSKEEVQEPIQTIAQAIKERLNHVTDPLTVEMLDTFLYELLCMNTDGSVLIGRTALWNGEVVPVVRLVGTTITVPGEIALAAPFLCSRCQQNRRILFLMSSVMRTGIPSYVPAKLNYSLVLNERGELLFDLGKTSYVCVECQKGGGVK